MQFWVKLKAASSEDFYHVNLKHVSHMFRDESVTTVCLVGNENVVLHVEETPETILALRAINDVDRT
jgi:hypothetical protein